jgi:hypothetical protein
MSIWTCPYCEFVNAGSSCEKCDKALPPDELCFFQTPPHITEALLERVEFETPIWEPCAGAGAISNVLRRYYRGGVYASDIWDHGVGLPKINFLEGRYDCASVVTNPPYKDGAALKFIRRALEVAPKVAFLLGVASIGKDINNVMRRNRPLSRIIVVPKFRYRQCSYDSECAWVVWDANYRGNKATIEWVR